MAVNLPRDSATILAVHPREEVEVWDVQAHLLASVVDLLAGANWQRTGKRTGRPKPIKRPKARHADRPGFESPEDFRRWYAAQPGGRQLNNN